MKTFKLSDSVDKNKVFIVQRSELEGRFEPEYYKPSISYIEKKVREQSNKKLRDYIVKISSGATPSVVEEEKFYADKDTGIPFLRVQNLQTNGELNIKDVKYINIETHQKYLKRSQVSEGNLLVKITGVGRMAIASVAPKDFVGNTNQHMVVIKTEDVKTSEYLANYLNLDIVEKLASRRSTGGTRPALDYKALKSIPIIEDLDFTPIHNVEKIKQQKESEAKALLASIDKYLLNELGITLPNKNNSLESRIFTTSSSELSGSRFDPDYFSIYYKSLQDAIERSLFKTEKLKDISIKIFSGKTPSSSDYSDDITDYAVIKVGSYTEDLVDISKQAYTTSSQPYSIEEGDIFILSAAHQAEYVGRHIKYLKETPKNKTSFVGELLCIRTDKLKMNSQFLYSLLNLELYKTLINREKTGQTSHIYSKDIKNILVPTPPIEKQNEIASYIQNTRNKARQLQENAKKIVEEAKKEVEKMILGEL
ncbi:MAG: restriction endonuclease subunit S [Moheibacter sp.]